MLPDSQSIQATDIKQSILVLTHFDEPLRTEDMLCQSKSAKFVQLAASISGTEYWSISASVPLYCCCSFKGRDGWMNDDDGD
jgi:hypothetical protein